MAGYEPSLSLSTPGRQTASGGAMKIYIMTDMEGISGINREVQVQPGRPEYEAARALLAADVNAAIAGAFEAGAALVVGND